MKKPLLLTLLLLILPLLSFAESTSPPPSPSSGSVSATDSKPSLLPTPGWGEILQVDPATAQILDQEISRALSEAWNSGYKTARVKFEPMVDLWKAEAQSEKARFWDGFKWGLGTGAGTTIVVIAGAALLYAAVTR